MPQGDTSFGEYLAVLRSRWLSVLLIFALVLGAALAYSLVTSPKYRATAEILVDSNQSFQIVDPSTGQRTDEERLIETEVAFIRSRSVDRAVEDELGAKTSIEARAAADANVITISAVSSDAEYAATVANTYAGKYLELRRERAVQQWADTTAAVLAVVADLDAELAELDAGDPARVPLEADRSAFLQAQQSLSIGEQLSGGINAQVISAADPPTTPFEPQVLRNLVLGAVAGLVLGVGAALLREALDNSIRTKRELEEATAGLPTLALVPSAAGWRDRSDARVFSVDEPDSPVAEAYRTLRTALQFISLDRTFKIVQITSPKPGEGKSTTTANLAIAFARAGKKVVVVDCDLRKPRAHAFFDLEVVPGVTNILLGEMEPADAAKRPLADLPVLVIPAGPLAPNPSEALGSSSAYELMEKLRKVADIVLIDSPPVLPVADPRVLADKVDATILVTQAKGSSRQEVGRALELLNQVNAPVIGAVLNKVGKRAEVTYGYGYRYSYTQESGDTAAPAGEVDLTASDNGEGVSPLAAVLKSDE